MADLLYENNLEVREVTTDPDSSAGGAADSLYQDGLLKEKPTHYLDTRHLSESVPKSIKRDENLLKVMSTANKAEKSLHLMQSTGSQSRSTRPTSRTPGMLQMQ